mgnify:FL=1
MIQTLAKSSLSDSVCTIIRQLLTDNDRDLVLEALSILEERQPSGFSEAIATLIHTQTDPFIRKKAESLQKHYGG